MANKYGKIKRGGMVNYVIYGHTDYLDVLQIQTDNAESIPNKLLFINKNNLNLNNIYNKYKNVFLYDDSNPYPQRLSECLRQIDDEYILFLHDIDILLSVNQNTINNFYNFLKHHNYDRIDLKHTSDTNTSMVYECERNKNYQEWRITKNLKDKDNLFLIKQNDQNKYIYNVNPSIWKRSSLLEIMETFPNKNYRTIEDIDVQEFTKKYSIFKIYSSDKRECGHFDCINDFVFFHITHNGSFVPLNGQASTIYGQPYWSVKDQYEYIVEKYNLKKSNKWKY
jgi:hypothetical protein